MGKNNQHTEFLAIDIESSCWPENQTPIGMISEIIEIGYAIFDATNNEIKSHGSILVKPQVSTISSYCTNLTTLTQEIVDRGVSFEEACQILKQDLNSLGRPWCSFGEYDRTMFVEQCKRLNVSYPFTKQHLNLKQMAAAILGTTQGLGATVNALGLQFEGQQHRGGDDALNVARILQYYKAKFGEKILA
jgi:inhibitor of KinA sporulation pathway (predicted exonuclease)